MGYYLAFPILALMASLQSGVLPGFRLDNGQPELIFLAVAAWAVHASWEEAVFWALLGGMMQDLLSITPTGTSAISMLLIVFGIKWLSQGLYGFNILLLFGFVGMGTIIHHTILVTSLSISGYTPRIGEMLRFYTLPTLALNLVGILPVYIMLRRVQVRLPRSQTAWEVTR